MKEKNLQDQSSFWAERPQDRSLQKGQDRGHPTRRGTCCPVTPFFEIFDTTLPLRSHFLYSYFVCQIAMTVNVILDSP